MNGGEKEKKEKMDYQEQMEEEAKWVEIDLDALARNMKQIRIKSGDGVRIAAVIKANGYGHAAAEIVQVLLESGADQFAVSSLDEAMELRSCGVKEDILVLSSIPCGSEEISVTAGIQHTVTSEDKALLLSQAAVKTGKEALLHIAVDTGMTRIGFSPDEEGADAAAKIASLPGIKIDGLFTHFATADEADKTKTLRQHERFLKFAELLEERGVRPRLLHAANSAAIMELPQTYHDMVRPGIILYGIYPSAEVNRDLLPLEPVMSFKTRILYVKTLKEDREVSYGGRFLAPAGSQIGTVGVGYADGFSRAQSGKAQVLFRGKRVNVLGNICMDQCMIDLSSFSDVKAGEEVTLIGRQGDEEITADEVAARYGTIGYEVVCAVSRRVPRFFRKDGRLTGMKNYLDIPME